MNNLPTISDRMVPVPYFPGTNGTNGAQELPEIEVIAPGPVPYVPRVIQTEHIEPTARIPWWGWLLLGVGVYALFRSPGRRSDW